MLDTIAALTHLNHEQLLFSAFAVLLAGMVRGFAGFGLSAILMASVVVIIPPIELIPICFLLEATAGILMLRGGLKDADMPLAWILSAGNLVGTPIGLWATNILPTQTSKVVVLAIIISLTTVQILGFKMAFLRTKSGLYGTGLVAGLVTGLASVGGMVVALYTLARDDDSKTVRASLVVYLFLGTVSSTLFLLLYDMLTQAAIYRALVLAPVVIIGVILGGLLFRPSLQGFYKRFCLLLLMSLSIIGLLRIL